MRIRLLAAFSAASLGAVAAPLAALPAVAAPSRPACAPGPHGSASVDLVRARVGTGDLRAQAQCPSATASVALLDATVLPGPGDSLLRVPGEVNSSATVTGSASARTGLTDVRLFDGTTGRVAVKVLTE